HLIPHLSIGAPATVIGSLGLAGVLPGLLALAVLAVLGAAWLLARRRPRPAAVEPGQADLLRLYDRLQARLGRRRAPPETPLEYRAAHGPEQALLGDVTELVNRGAYRGDWPRPEAVAALADKLDRR